jgi:hypothetical protein
MLDHSLSEDSGSTPSSESGVTREEFIRKIVKGAALTGGLMASARVLDRFLVPRAYASASGGGACVPGGMTVNGGSSSDTAQLSTAFGVTDVSSVCAGFHESSSVGASNDNPATDYYQSGITTEDTLCSADSSALRCS